MKFDEHLLNRVPISKEEEKAIVKYLVKQLIIQSNKIGWNKDDIVSEISSEIEMFELGDSILKEFLNRQ